MSLSEKQLQAKRKRKSDNRARVDARRDYLFHRYGTLVGEMIYRFERVGKSGRKPSELILAMKASDTHVNSDKDVPAPIPSGPTTGDIHRKRRSERKALQDRIASQGPQL